MRSKPTPAYTVSLDTGNSNVKGVVNAFSGGTENRVVFRSAFAPITRNDYDRALSTARGNDAGVVMVDGRAYAVGDAALRHQHTTRKGAARYTRDYVGVLAAAAFYRLLPVAECRVDLIASHAPRDFDQRHRLIEALSGQYIVEGSEGRRVYNVDKVVTIDESIGSIFHHLLTHNLQERRNSPMRDGSTVVGDIGGLTSDFAAIDQTPAGPQIDASAMASVTIGTGHLHAVLERHLRSAYADVFWQQSSALSFARLEAALHSGVYQAGRHSLDVSDFVRQELLLVTAQIADTIETTMGGLLNYTNVMITGGGGALLLPYLQERFKDLNLFLADDTPGNLIYANASGANRLMRLLAKEAKGAV